MQYKNSNICHKEVMSNVIFFLKIGQTSRSKGLVTAEGSCHKKYQSSSSQISFLLTYMNQNAEKF